MVALSLVMNPRRTTAPLRCLPDVYVLGEVRCGTTTVASLLRDELGMAGPFTPWVHPLANEKESFFLVGHYWGYVPRWAYRMCFPLRLSHWWYRVVLGRPFAAFEGCASYLSAPWAPALVRALTPRAVLVVCVREPVAQNLSWWRLEQAGMAWGSSMGLGERFASLQDVAACLRDRDRPALQALGDVLAIEELHDHVGRAAGEGADVGDLRHVVALDARGGLRFALKPLDVARVLRRLGEQELDRDRRAQRGVRRGDDATHPADAEHALDAVLLDDDVSWLGDALELLWIQFQGDDECPTWPPP